MKHFFKPVLLLSLVSVAMNVIATPFSIEPQLLSFKPVNLGEVSEPLTLTIANTSDSIQEIGQAAIATGHIAAFVIDSDTCSGRDISPGSSCQIGVRFLPVTAGKKMAMLTMQSLTNGKFVSAFVASEEHTLSQAKRRLPLIVNSMSLPSTMQGGVSYAISWSALGYDDDYETKLVAFDCTGLTKPACGVNWGDRIWDSGDLNYLTKVEDPIWTYYANNANSFSYSTDFVAPTDMPGTNDIVFRLYQRSLDDALSSKPSISLVIPGGAGLVKAQYYDLEGRRVSSVLTNVTE